VISVELLVLLALVLVQSIVFTIVIVMLYDTKNRLDMMWKVLRTFLDVMNELRAQVEKYREVTEPEVPDG
jgi:hypothetical protein